MIFKLFMPRKKATKATKKAVKKVVEVEAPKTLLKKPRNAEEWAARQK